MPCPEWEVVHHHHHHHHRSAGSATIMSESCVAPLRLSEQLEDGEPLLLLDCRSAQDYNTSHIDGAIHVAIPSLMLKRLKKGNIGVASVISGNESRDRFDRLCKSDSIVVYDESTEDLSTSSTGVVSLLINRLKEDGCRVCLLQGGFDTFQGMYPMHCVRPQGLTNDDQTIIGLGSLRISDADTGVEEVPTPNSAAAFPVQVLPYLFLGNAKNSGDLECLYKNGITYILNVTPNVANTFENNTDFKYMQIPISDHWSQNLAHYFTDAIGFIDEARSKKSGVLVHCLAGVSRSVTVTVAYLMSSMSLSLNDAYDYVKRCKPNISPNFNFMGQLLDFEKTLNHGSHLCTCCCGSSSASSSGNSSASSSSGGDSSATSSAASSASSTDGSVDSSGGFHKCSCTQSFFTSPVSTPPMNFNQLPSTDVVVSATPS